MIHKVRGKKQMLRGEEDMSQKQRNCSGREKGQERERWEQQLNSERTKDRKNI